MRIKSLLTAFVISVVSGVVPAQAEGLAGPYLAARHASYRADFDKAAEYYTQALARDPSNPMLLENALTSFVGLGQIDRALPVARKIQSQGIKSQIATMVLAVDLIKAADYDALLENFADGQSVGPLVDGLIVAWAELGRGQMAPALDAFDKVADGQGTRAFGLYHKALALASVGDFEGADRIFSGEEAGPLRATRRGVIAHIEVLSQLERQDDALELMTKVFGDDLDPQLVAYRDALSAGEALPFTLVTGPTEGLAEVFYSVAGALSGEASDTYTLVFARLAEYLNPEHTDAILLSARLLEDLELYDLATAAYDRVPRDDPEFQVAELGRAGALRKSGNSEAAVEVLRQLAESHGDQPRVYTALGDILRQLERNAEATAAYDKAVALLGEPQPNQWFVYYARGITLERQGEWDKAERDFRTALKLQPDQPQVLNYLGYSLVEKNIKLDEALDMIERAVAAEPNSGYITDSLGWVLYRLGRYDEAVGHMERAAELMPVDPIVNDHLGDVFWAVGRRLEAEFQWRRALSFVDDENASGEADPDRIRRKLEVGLDTVLEEEGSEPLAVSKNGG